MYLGHPQCYSKLVHKPPKVVYIHCELVLKAVYKTVRGKVVHSAIALPQT